MKNESPGSGLAANVVAPMLTLTEIFWNADGRKWNKKSGVDIDAADIVAVQDFNAENEHDQRRAKIKTKNSGTYDVAETRDQIRDMRARAIGF